MEPWLIDPPGETLWAPQMDGTAAIPSLLLVPTSVAVGTLNGGRFFRWVAPRSGTISTIWVPVGTSSGNIDVGLYDTAGATRTRLGSSGSVACPAGNAWGAVSLTAGVACYRLQQFDVGLAVDNGTATFGRQTIGLAQLTQLPAAAFPGGAPGLPWLTYTIASVFPLPATIAESGMSGSNLYPLIPVIT